MRVVFIKETKISNFYESINTLKNIVLNRVYAINENGLKIYVLPITNNNGNNKNKYIINRIVKKLLAILDKEKTNTIVLSNDLKNNVYLQNKLYSENIDILDGRLLFKILSINCLEYILNIKKEQLKDSEVHILVNDYNSINTDIIVDIAKKAKIVSLITNNISRFKKVEKQLYNEYGIGLSIVNNKRISLLKAKIIINIDFPSELINKYRIYNKAIIINMQEKIKINSKQFNGVNINYYNINIPEKYNVKEFTKQEVYESIIYNMNNQEAQRRVTEDNLQIENLIGNKGIILEEEFL